MKRGVFILLVTLSLNGSAENQTIDLYVSPNGNDVWSGTLSAPDNSRTDGPLATLNAARYKARKLNTQKPKRIVVQGGEYFLEEPFVLGVRDSGLTFEAAPGQKVVLYGGRRVTGWEQDGDHFWSANVPEVAAKEWDFRMLVVNGRFCKRARLPKDGRFTHLSKFDVPWMSTTGGGWKRKPTHKELTTLKYRPEDLGPWLDIRNVELTIYHMWDESVVGIASMDEETHTLTFSNSSGHPPGAFGIKKYVVWNVREGMTEPGQWHLDRSAGKVVYWPQPGEEMTTAEVIVPTIESIIRLAGRKEAPVKDVTLRGLTLSVTNTPLEAGGFGAYRFQGALSATFTENCRFLDLELINVGGHGIKAQQCDGLHIENCEVRDTGACGIIARANDAVVTRNHVHRIGLTYPSAIAVAGGGQRGEISHNEIHDTPYTAINCGGKENRVEKNLIYRAMLELHDGGGIYMFAGKGNLMRGNLIRDIPDTGGYGSSAYYLDEQSEGCVVEGNLSLRVQRPSHNHMARKNTIRNNVFISDGDARLTFQKSSDFRFEKNVIYAKGEITITNATAITESSANIFFSGTGVVEGRPPETLQADPLFIDLEKGDYRYVPDSPALGLGIRPIDVGTAGRPGAH